MGKRINDNDGLWKGAFSIVLGAIMLIWPGLTTNTIVTVLGVGLLALGMVMLIGYLRRKKAEGKARFPLGATVCLLLGLAMVITPQVFVNILMIIFGAILALAGLDQIIVLARGNKSGIKLPVFFYIVPVLVLTVGLYIILFPAASAESFIILFGVTAIIYGAVVLYSSYTLRHAEKNAITEN